MFKSLLAKPFAAWEAGRISKWRRDPVGAQQRVFRELLRKGSGTAFGKDHCFSEVRESTDFQQAVPMRDYEALRPWVDRAVEGEADVLWPGRPAYFAKTSGTTSGSKFIPLTKDSMPNHIGSARAALTSYIHETGKSGFVNGKMIFLQGSPVLTDVNGVPTGRLSGLVYHHVPAYLLRNRMPSYETNCIEDWEQKVEAIVRETAKEPMTLISGIPPWVVMYFERLLAYTGASSVREIFPDFSLFVYGGVNYQPYAARIRELIGDDIDALETYPASEGFIAWQDSLDADGLLLNVESGIWFEFVPVSDWGKENARRLTIEEVETGVNYAIILSNNAGLWSYVIGDTVRFTSLEPARIVVTGRLQHYISAFGEHVIAEEVEAAMVSAISELGVDVAEFTVAPHMGGDGQLPRHEWFVEFRQGAIPDESARAVLEKHLESELRQQNSYYDDLIDGNVLQPLAVRTVRVDGFTDFLRSKGKLGGQNKIPRLANDRRFADDLSAFLL